MASLIDWLVNQQFDAAKKRKLVMLSRRAGHARKGAEISRLIEAAVILFLALLVSGILTITFLSMPLSGLLLLGASVLSLRLPEIILSILARFRIKRIESELPFMLRYFAQLLELGVIPEAALKQISRMESFGELGVILSEALSEKQKGKLLEKALSDMDARLGSKKHLGETVSTIIQTLRLGTSKESLRITRRLAARMIEEKKREYLSFTAKSQVLLIVFTMLSAVIPAIIAFIVAFGGLVRPYKSFTIYAIFLIILPALSIIELLVLKLNSPV